ncbi:MAG: DUF3179 domain-containing (seleno)protein [Acidimicrobiales bacterium]
MTTVRFHGRLQRVFLIVFVSVLAVTACSSDDETAADPEPEVLAELESQSELGADLARLVASFGPNLDPVLIDEIVARGDESAVWVLVDLLRFQRIGTASAALLSDGLTRLGVTLNPERPWKSATNDLLTRAVAAPPDYERLKTDLLSAVDARWRPLLDVPHDLDFRWLAWGGVFIDDRPLGNNAACSGRGCIPALDFPGVTPADQGLWYSDDKIVFGVVINGEARAYQQNIMQVHEMVNDVVGGRRIAIPYCTLCGSAQGYFTDEVGGVALAEAMVFRTSGLLSRSNKIMYELGSQSIFDTFTGRAVSGDLFTQDVTLTQLTVQVATWGEWRGAHPETTIVAGDGGAGRVYPEDPLFGRDDNGPIFPIGELDERLGVQDAVVGATAPDGTSVAFVVADVKQALEVGTTVTYGGLQVTTDGAGLRIVTSGGAELPTHESFWFAWSQFHPETLLWTQADLG